MKQKTIAANFTRPRMGRRLAVLTVSIIAIGICVAVFKAVGFGTDPCSTFTLGVSARTGVSFGTCQLVFNLLMFLPVIRFDLSRIGVGTVANMAGVGYVADFCMRLIGQHTPPEGFSMAARVLMFAVSMAAFGTAVAGRRGAGPPCLCSADCPGQPPGRRQAPGSPRCRRRRRPHQLPAPPSRPRIKWMA